MFTDLTVHLSEHVFALLAEQAASVGKTPEELVVDVVESTFVGEARSTRDPATARAEFEQCFGSVDLGRPIGTVNPAIDVDLANEYGTPSGSA